MMAPKPKPFHVLPAMLWAVHGERTGVTVADLAARAGMSRQVVSVALSGRRSISERTVEKLIVALGYQDPLDFYLHAVTVLLVARDGKAVAADKLRAARLRIMAAPSTTS